MSLVVKVGALATGTGEVIHDAWLRSRHGEIVEIGTGPGPEAGESLQASGCVAVPGLVNCHDHLYQWATRGRAPEEGLFGWLKALYPVWATLDAEVVKTAARAGIGRLLLAGCTTTSDHHYIVSGGRTEVFDAIAEAGRELGIRLLLCRGSMSLGESQGGLPPDSLVERHDDILAATEELAGRLHDPSPGWTTRIAVAPCSPFSVTPELMRDSAALARRRGLRLHTHLAETGDETEFCLERFGKRPLDLMEELGWIGPDVWFAHGVHFDRREVARLGSTGTGVAHCPSSNMRLGSGAAPVRELLEAGAPVGLGVDGAASNEDYDLLREAHQALLLGRLRAALLGAEEPSRAIDARTAWQLATRGGAACLGVEAEQGSLETGRRADLALYRLDDLGRSGIEDPLQALALAPPARAEFVIVDGRVTVRGGRLVNADEDQLAAEVGRIAVAR